jgi:16S rRNA (guanine527-N7)-methyltransferase
VRAPEDVLEQWLGMIVAERGLTAFDEPDAARGPLLDDALRGVPLVAAAAGPVVDVGSGGGTPGIPLAVSLPEREVTLLEAERRKCDALERMTAALGLANVGVVWGRAESQPVDCFGVAVAKALAPPPVAAELCLPLVRPGGMALLWVGPSVEPERVAAVAARLAAQLEDAPDGFLLLRKTGPTPPGFPRRPGVPARRPLA